MKFKGTLIGEASGSVASLTFSHNRGGQYIRQRVVPTDKGSTFQTVIRALVASLTSAWSSELSPAERAAWDTYALNVPLLDTLGDPRNVGGLGQYIRSNVPRMQAGLARIDVAPAIFDLGTFTPPTLDAVTAASDDVDIGFTNTDAWATTVGGAMLVYVSRPFNPGRTFFKGPYRFAGSIDGAMVAPTSPATIAAPFPFVVGQQIGVQIRVAQADGRLSMPFRLTGVGV